MAVVVGNRGVGTGTNKTYGVNCTVGSLLVAMVSRHTGGATATVSDNVNGAWTAAIGPVQPAGQPAYFFYFPNNTSAAKPIVTPAWSGGSGPGIAIWEVTGLANGGTFDTGNFADSGGVPGTTFDSGATATLAQAAEAAFAYFGNCATGGPTFAAGWTNATAVNSFNFDSVADQVTAATTPLHSSGTLTLGGWEAMVATFKDAPGGASASRRYYYDMIGG